MLKITAIILLSLGALIAMWVIFFGGYFSLWHFTPDTAKAKDIQPFITGLVAPLLTLGSTLLVLENLRISTRQNFNTNFLKLLDFHHKIVDSITTTVAGISSDDLSCKSSDKRAFFDDLCFRIAQDFSSGKIYKTTEELPEDSLQRFTAIYKYYYNIHHSDMSHYMRHFCNLLQYIEEEGQDESARLTMARLLKTQLSNYEMLLLAYHGIVIDTSQKEKLKKYNILEGLNYESDLNPEIEKRIISDVELLKKQYQNIASKENKPKEGTAKRSE